MNEEKRNELKAMLVELSLKETHNELNRFMNKKDKKNALKLSKVEDAITTLLEYLEK